MIEIEQRIIKSDHMPDYLELEGRIAAKVRLDINDAQNCLAKEHMCHELMNVMANELNEGYILGDLKVIYLCTKVDTHAEEQDISLHGPSDDVR